MSESVKRIDNGRIIIVDNDINMREMMVLVLTDLFQIATVRSADEALAMVISEEPFDIVMASYVIHGMSGLEFLRRVGEICPRGRTAVRPGRRHSGYCPPVQIVKISLCAKNYSGNRKVPLWFSGDCH